MLVSRLSRSISTPPMGVLDFVLDFRVVDVLDFEVVDGERVWVYVRIAPDLLHDLRTFPSEACRPSVRTGTEGPVTLPWAYPFKRTIQAFV